MDSVGFNNGDQLILGMTKFQSLFYSLQKRLIHMQPYP